MSGRNASHLTFILGFLLLVFAVMLFKNIAYPLLWNDEADTAIFATSILHAGYPKAHLGKNTIIHFPYGPSDLSINESIDAYVANGWLQYYFAAPFVWLAGHVSHIYLKTAIVRSPFAAAGFAGVIIAAWSVLPLFRKKSTRYHFLISFVLLELTSVYLLLHLRQVRAHPLTLLLSSCILFLWIRHTVFHAYPKRTYIILQTILFFVLFHAFYPAFGIFCITMTLIELPPWIKRFVRNGLKQAMRDLWKSQNMRICLLSVLAVSPFILLFEIPRIPAGVARYFSFDFSQYVTKLGHVFVFFLAYELLGFAIMLKSIIWYTRKQRNPSSFIQTAKAHEVSKIFSVFFVTYALSASYSPMFYFRYLVTLQPILMIIILLDFFTLLERVSRYSFVWLLAFGMVFFGLSRFSLINQYVYEITHQYRGSLDYVIPYIMEKYKDPASLVIATNYEEQSYMYYLGSHVTIGYTGANLVNDMEKTPDIIIPRKSQTRHMQYMYDLLWRNDYTKTSFPILDYPVNNIPELLLYPRHLFRTTYADSPKQMVDLYEK